MPESPMTRSRRCTSVTKFDGTCVMLDPAGKWWTRREVKPGKTPPANYRAVGHDEVTGKTTGWEPMAQSPFAKFHEGAVAYGHLGEVGTYELIGPKINGNPEGVDRHELVRHGKDGLPLDHPMVLVDICRQNGWEGVVWHDRALRRWRTCVGVDRRAPVERA